MSYSNEERSRLRAKEGLDVPLESQRTTTPGVSCKVQQSKEWREYSLDNTLSETFPCSDPLSSIPNPMSHSF